MVTKPKSRKIVLKPLINTETKIYGSRGDAAYVEFKNDRYKLHYLVGSLVERSAELDISQSEFIDIKNGNATMKELLKKYGIGR